jgi:hypothetical protein
VLAVGCVFLLVSGCSQTVIVRTDAPSHVVIDGRDLGVVDEDGASVDVTLGVFPVAYTIERNGVRVQGELDRTRPSWLPNTAGLCGPFFTAPCCVCVGVSCANPQVFASPVFCLLASLGNANLLFGACYGLCAQLSLTPGWMTVPLGCAGLTLGMWPLFLLGFGGLDDQVVLTMPAHVDTPLPGASERTPDKEGTPVEPGASDVALPPPVEKAPDEEEMRW